MPKTRINTQTGRLFKTSNYDLFELHPRNRDLHSDTTLDRSMEAHGFMPSRPIQCIVNGSGKLKVIAGNNRLDRAMRLGIPVYYVIDDSCTDLFELEGTGRPRWSVKDFAVAYAKAGKREYQFLLDFQEKHHLTLGIAATLVGGYGSPTKTTGTPGAAIRKGTFKRGDMKAAHEVVRITAIARESGVPFATNSNFVAAILACVMVPEFDADILTARMRRYPKNMLNRSCRDDFLDEIEDLYNFKTRNKIPLAMLAKQATKRARK